MLKARVVANEEEWSVYAATFAVPKREHSPKGPPSYPVMVISHVINYGCAGSEWVSHSFIEAHDLKKMLA
jgi:hypothetical protein